MRIGKLITICIIIIQNLCISTTFYPQIVKAGNDLKECNIILGKWIKKNSDPDASLAVSDVGAIPYYAGIRTIDIHEQSLQDKHVLENFRDAEYILDQNITFLILSATYNFIKIHPDFIKYRLIVIASLQIGYNYEVYLLKSYYIPESEIKELIDSSDRFSKPINSTT